MNTRDLVQGSPEWIAARVGKVTASRVSDVIAKTKTGYSASRAGYMAELIAERMTGVPAQRYKNAAMEWGNECEPAARINYEFLKGVAVRQVGLIPHPTIPMSAASPDGVVADGQGIIEIKCPETHTHLEYLLSGPNLPGKYKAQVQWQMACTGAVWADWISFDPRLPERMQLCIVRVGRDAAYIRELETEVRAFLAELSDKVAKLEALYGAEDA